MNARSLARAQTHNEPERSRLQVSANHRRVLAVRLRLLEESLLRLLDLFQAEETVFTSRPALQKDKAEHVERRVHDLRSKISVIKSDLGLERGHEDAGREANALIAHMTVAVEELYPEHLKGYGEVPEALTRYLEEHLSGILKTLKQITETLG